MGQQPYIIRLALGRSPYELPDSSSGLTQAAETAQSHGSPANADRDYVQQYDERGHPIFPKSKVLARDLRRAKNDVLSTMGVVVSGETGRSGASRDRKKVKSISAENDYGLVIVAFDHIMHFFGSWWVGSLGNRIQTFKRYTHVPLWSLVQSEIHEVGWSGLLFAGIPTWALRVTLPICRTHLFEPLMAYLQDKLMSHFDVFCTRLAQNTFLTLKMMIRTLLFVLFEQTHMFCILQAIHIIPHSSFPKISFLLPFTQSSLIRCPSLPNTISPAKLGQFASVLVTAPFTLALTYALARPFVEDRIYRILQRQLPKQEQPDELSIQVAMDNDLLEWTVPASGRRMEDEARRSNLSVLEDIMEEFRDLRKQLIHWLGWGRESLSDNKMNNHPVHDAPDSIRNDPESVRHEVSNAAASSQVEPSFDTGQILANEQLTHSPAEITPRSLDGLRPIGQTGVDPVTNLNVAETSWLPFQGSEQGSRSNTLFSRPASPESPPASPRIRASLTHQNSFTTTMELSLQTSRNLHRNQQVDAEVVNHRNNAILDDWSLQIDNPGPHSNSLDLVLDQTRPVLRDTSQIENAATRGLTAVQSDASDLAQPATLNTEENDVLWGMSDENTVVPAMAQLTVLPDMVEEPLHSPTRQGNMDLVSEAGTQELTQVQSHSLPWGQPWNQHGTGPFKQRVTVLSSFPADALAHHLASLISGVLFIPFRSLLYRTLATAYLSSPAAAIYGINNAVSLTDIRDFNAFAGGGSRRDVVAYMGKLTMIFGVQVAVSGGIIGVCSAAAVGIGKRLFGWGQL